MVTRPGRNTIPPYPPVDSRKRPSQIALGITVGATLITAGGASREKPLVVRRYE
ncbi:MAG: hypothetical protein M9930_10055 [Anaerolineae bacterium]|nr:hypothetical protein [Anaerolineae bacterium]